MGSTAPVASSGVAHEGALHARDEWVVVVPVEELIRRLPSTGLIRGTVADPGGMLGLCTAIPRTSAEARQDVVQLVSGFIVTCGESVVTYRRTRRSAEQRLGGEASAVFGGHLGPSDLSPLFSIFDPVDGEFLLERELNEELKFSHRPKLQYIGLVYDSERDISRQHLGILYHAQLASPEFAVREPGRLRDARFESLGSVAASIEAYENWSRLLLPYFRELLGGRSEPT